MIFLVISLLSLSTIDCAVIGSRIEDQTGIVQTFLSTKAAIGDSLSRKGEEGLLVLSSKGDNSLVDLENDYGCEPITPAPQRLISGYPWVLLIRRGNCEFGEKLSNAEDAGYTLVIVYNNKNDDLMPMNGDVDVRVKAVFVGLSTGETLIAKYLYSVNQRATVTLTPYYTLPWHMYIIPFLIVISICFLLMFIFLVIKKVRRYQRRRRARLPTSKLKKLKVIIYTESDNYDMCAICLDDFEEGDKLRILPCNHAYHTHCIDPWLTKARRVCPCCKQAVFPDEKSQVETPPSPDESGLDSSGALSSPAQSPSLSYESAPEPLNLAPNVVESPDENTPLVRHV